MKRSEMIDIICKTMYWTSHNRSCADALLAELEKVEMLPPPVEKCNDDGVFERWCVWEDEDE